MQLTDSVLSNLTDLSLTNISLLYFEQDGVSQRSVGPHANKCKTFPGDKWWPSSLTWKVLDLVTGGNALIKTVPLSAACYDDWGVYDEARCAEVTEQFTNSSLQ